MRKAGRERIKGTVTGGPILRFQSNGFNLFILVSACPVEATVDQLMDERLHRFQGILAIRNHPSL